MDELRRHHAARFREVVAAIADDQTSAWAIAERMTWSRPWDEIDGWMRRAAVGEAVAHLLALRHRGVVGRRRDRDEPAVGAARRLSPATRAGAPAAGLRRGGRAGPP